MCFKFLYLLSKLLDETSFLLNNISLLLLFFDPSVESSLKMIGNEIIPLNCL